MKKDSRKRDGRTRGAAPKRLYHQSSLDARRRDEYYRALNRHPPFAAALRDLYETAAAALPTELSNVPRPPAEAQSLVDDFTRKWSLPDDGPGLTSDLWASLGRAAHGEQLELQQAARAVVTHEPPPAVATVELVPHGAARPPATQWLNPSHWHPVEESAHQHGGEVIWPFVPLPFVYDPRARDAAWIHDYADRLANIVRDNIIDQANAVAQRVKGKTWVEESPHLRSETGLQRGALRLFQRVVLGWNPARIAREEGKEWLVVAISETTVDWAKKVGITLPPARRGRPRNEGK